MAFKAETLSNTNALMPQRAWLTEKEEREERLKECDQSLIVRKAEKPFISGYSNQQKSYQVGPCVLE